MRSALASIGLLLLAALVPALASGHAERATYFPDPAAGARPELRTSGPSIVVCKRDSARRIRRSWRGDRRRLVRKRRQTLRLLKRCRHRHIQAAVNAAKSGDRILVMPGVYREGPSRKVPFKDPKCADNWEASGDNHQEDGRVPTYEHQHNCPNSLNLIAIIGDTLEDEDRVCDQRCNLQIHGMGRGRRAVKIVGDRIKTDVIRADRADGFLLHKVSVEQAAYNDVDIVETNGFRVSKLLVRWAKNYGVLSFASDNGLYAEIEAYGNGDSGVYPGSGPEGHCDRYGIELRNINSFGNTQGVAGTAGNGTWIHDSKFHHNSAGISADSFAPGHPGMPQDCSKYTDNEIYSNNVNYFAENKDTCRNVPFEDRPKELVCPQFLAVVGTGIMFYGVNDNVIENNRIYDNWRSGMRLFWVPATLRGENDPAAQDDTTNGNRTVNNFFGLAPDGSYAPNGEDVLWDEQGVGNCWEGNVTAPGRPLTTDPMLLPDCASGGSNSPVSNPAKTGADAPCAAWNPRTNPDPPGCSWFTSPPRPSQ